MANGDQPTQAIIDRTVTKIIQRVEVIIGETIADNIIVKEVRAHDYFKDTLNSYKGNAFGLAHTLRQSAILRPPIKNPKLESLYYVGQYTNPGTGVPIVTLGGGVVAKKIIADRQGL
jgi:phytoene desaturase